MSTETIRSDRFQIIPIYGALLCLGYLTSLFLTFSFIVMPGLATIDDRAFVTAFQGLEARFQSSGSQYGNVPTILALPGALLFSVVAAIMHRKESYGVWLLAAPILYAVGMITTVLYNVPPNSAIFTAGAPNVIDVTQVRRSFDEVSWTNWNHFRAGAFFLAFVCVLRGLHLMMHPRNI